MQKLFFVWLFMCPFGLRVRTTSELFQLPKFVYANFCFKVFRMPRIVVFFQKRTIFFFQVKFFFIFKKSYLFLKLFTALCFCCGLRQVKHLLWERGGYTFLVSSSLTSMLQIILFPL